MSRNVRLPSSGITLRLQRQPLAAARRHCSEARAPQSSADVSLVGHPEALADSFAPS